MSERLSELATDLSGSKKYTKLHGTFSALDVQEWIINLDLPVIKYGALHAQNLAILPIWCTQVLSREAGEGLDSGKGCA